jgi:leucyl aminopeptidase
MKIAFAKPELPGSGTLVVGVLEEHRLTHTAQLVDKQTKGAIARALSVGRFEGRPDEQLAILAPQGIGAGRILLVGLGKAEALDSLALQAIGGRVVAALNAAGEHTVSIAADEVAGLKLSLADVAAHIAFGARLRSYRFDKYRTREKPEQKPTLKRFVVMSEDPAAAKRAFEPLEKVGEGVFLTRDLVSEPANVIFPESLAEETKKLSALGVEIEVLGEKQMKKLGMGALLGVGQGSTHESQLVIMRWQGAGDSKQRPVAFVGKGVTFDSGGISIKPAAGMEEMKWDMAGSGVVIGLMHALAARKARVNAVGIVGLVENMPSGSAQRPGDIVTSLSGQTIEVVNTDAEGRLVLADALWYCMEQFKPQFMVDLATLTGAVVVALGTVHAGLFANNDTLAERLADAGKATGELLWRMPLADAYDKQINTDAADMKNVGGRNGGSITAAQFLKRFVKDTPWAHLDIAGVTWSDKDAPTTPKGATAFGLRLLERLVADHYEER